MPQANKAISFVKKHKKKFIIGGAVYLTFMVLVVIIASIAILGNDDSTTSDYTPPATTTESPAEETPTVSEATPKAEDKPAEEVGSYTDALRKCTVMEAFDIHTTGIGAKTDNAFNDGRETCEWMFKSVYKGDEKDFIKTVGIDWEDRKSEQIDGESMPYYLGILGW